MHEAGVTDMATRKFHLTITDEGDGMLWARVEELPGCFASGANLDELLEAVGEAISLYLSEEGDGLAEVIPMRRDDGPSRPHPEQMLVSL